MTKLDTLSRAVQVKPLTERDYEVLWDLVDSGTQFVRVMDVGGHGGSHHHDTLTKLVRRGLAEAQRWTAPWSGRSHKRYRSTEAGREAIAAHRAAIGSDRKEI